MVVFGHQPSASTQMMSGASAACRAIKEKVPEQKLIILGGHVSALPERTLREEPVDFAAVGEGAVTLRQLLEVLRSDEPCSVDGVAGLAFRREGDIVINPMPALITDLDSDLSGDAWDLLPMHRYRAHNWQCFGELERRVPYASIYTSLGCPYKCAFCCINAPFGKPNYRMRSAAAVVGEIEHLYRTYGVRTFKIIDELFVLNDRHVRGICEALVELGFADELNIWAYARPDTVKPEQLAEERRHPGNRRTDSEGWHPCHRQLYFRSAGGRSGEHARDAGARQGAQHGIRQFLLRHGLSRLTPLRDGDRAPVGAAGHLERLFPTQL
jgi:radical SAM superfamily enzyme YgiQ (UPF0313 family)